jgi:hypothetical protein
MVCDSSITNIMNMVEVTKANETPTLVNKNSFNFFVFKKPSKLKSNVMRKSHSPQNDKNIKLILVS